MFAMPLTARKRDFVVVPLHHRAPGNLLFLQIRVNKSLTRSVAAVAAIVPTSDASQSETTYDFTPRKRRTENYSCAASNCAKRQTS